mmetsp:Transcript_122204/g.390891  ORF Transcript_122204/g.390891 Transcript_122204/m.390891 type:complete len:247 (-) Transcript_122204:924-1664(-)
MGRGPQRNTQIAIDTVPVRHPLLPPICLVLEPHGPTFVGTEPLSSCPPKSRPQADCCSFVGVVPRVGGHTPPIDAPFLSLLLHAPSWAISVECPNKRARCNEVELVDQPLQKLLPLRSLQRLACHGVLSDDDATSLEVRKVAELLEIPLVGFDGLQQSTSRCRPTLMMLRELVQMGVPEHCAELLFRKGIRFPLLHGVGPDEEDDGDRRIQVLSSSVNGPPVISLQEAMAFVLRLEVGLVDHLNAE